MTTALPSATPRRPFERSDSAGQIRRLLVRVHRDGDRRAREEVVQRMLPLARRVASRYRHTREPLDDLVQVASVGLVKAIDGFDPARQTAFSSYAVPTMVGEIKRYFRDTCWAVHVPRGMQERVLKIRTAVKQLGDDLGNTPSPSDIAEHAGLTVDEVLEGLEASGAASARSLDSYRFEDDDDNGASYAEVTGADDERYATIEDWVSVTPSFRDLPARERRILYLRFSKGMTQSEIGRRIGCSQMHVSRLIRRALGRINDAVNAGPLQRSA